MENEFNRNRAAKQEQRPWLTKFEAFFEPDYKERVEQINGALSLIQNGSVGRFKQRGCARTGMRYGTSTATMGEIRSKTSEPFRMV
ncbi:hypothetical protein V6N11_069090 [Hibiscus sabdariffa]|uniref:Uncharacterized protein n=1 Tax=Hibiscus sabdariffa TaxID=183260 RepID=A0ABR2A5K1_9ROSI